MPLLQPQPPGGGGRGPFYQPSAGTRLLLPFAEPHCTPASAKHPCLRKGQACLLGPREMGVCSRPRGRGPRPPQGQPPIPAPIPALAAYFVPNRSHFGSPGPHPGHREGCTGDILDTGFKQSACSVLSSFSQ
eukprot:XP_008757483.1 PREDICTED: splicing factor 3B subunit 4-like [Rattus norvegicus]